MPEADARLFSVRITSGVSSLFGMACVRLKTFAERTAGSAFVNAVEAFLAICAEFFGGMGLIRVQPAPVQRGAAAFALRFSQALPQTEARYGARQL